MIDASEVEERGVEVVDGDPSVGWFEAEFIGFAEGHSGFDAGSGEPAGEGIAVVFASESCEGLDAALAVGRASEFCQEDDEGIAEETAVVEVVEESGDGLIDFCG